MLRLMALGALCSVLALGAVGTALAGQPFVQVPAVIHSHSSWSTGDQSLEQLADLARQRGVEAVFLAENFFQRFEYGLPPLRKLLGHRVEFPSVLEKGPEAFLEAVSAVNARQTRVLVIPGVEVIPHYYWTGSLLKGSLTMHNGQKNILALGLTRPVDYRELPAVGNPHIGRWGPHSLLLLSPVLLVWLGGWLLTRKWRRVVELQRYRLVQTRRPVALALAVMGTGIALLVNNYPFHTAAVTPYNPHLGLKPFQAVIDHVASRGGLAVWSLPEARDNHTIQVAGFKATIKTDPYPDDLLRTNGFTAFGGVYEDTTAFTNPGDGWDQLLLDYLGGRRRSPAWAVGEAAYHHEGQAGKRFGEVRTVLLVERKDAAGLLEAFRAGRMYALRRTVEVGLHLDRFQVALPGWPPVQAGGQVAAAAETHPEVQVAVSADGPAPLSITARLIRSGAVVHTVKGATPLAFAWSDKDGKSGVRSYYRLEVQGPGGHRILSNPIFVTAGNP